MLNPQEGGRLDAKRHLVISAKALHRHDQVAKYHPVPWLRWPNVSWRQVFHLREPIVNLIIMHLLWIYCGSIVSLSWIYREPVPDASSWRIKFMKIMEFCLKWVHVARYGLILRLDGALWLRIIFKPLLTPKGAIKPPTSKKNLKVPAKPAKL